MMKIGIGVESVFARYRSGFGAPPASAESGGDVTPITRIPRGVAGDFITSGDQDGDAVIPSVTIGTTGSALAVAFGYQSNAGPIAGMSWGGRSLIQAASIVRPDICFEIWYLSNVTAGTDYLRADAESIGGISGFWDAIAVELAGAATNPFNVANVNYDAVGKPPWTTGSVTTTSDGDLLLAFFMVDGAASGGWSVFTAGQTASQANLVLEEGYRENLAAGTYSGVKTGAGVGPYVGGVAAFKRA